MNDSLTISTLSFTLAYKDKTGSERREVSRGVNLPTIMSIKSQDYVDSETKIPGVRTVLRFDKVVEATDGKPVKVSAYLVVAVPSDANIVSTDVTDVVGHINGVLDGTSPNLALGTNIFVTREQ